MTVLPRLCAPALALVVMAAACAGAPDATPPAGGGERPVVHGRSGPLSSQESDAILARLRRESAGSDILARHLAIAAPVPSAMLRWSRGVLRRMGSVWSSGLACDPLGAPGEHQGDGERGKLFPPLHQLLPLSGRGKLTLSR